MRFVVRMQQKKDRSNFIQREVWKGKQEKSIRKAAFILIVLCYRAFKLFNFKIFPQKSTEHSSSDKHKVNDENGKEEKLKILNGYYKNVFEMKGGHLNVTPRGLRGW